MEIAGIGGTEEEGNEKNEAIQALVKVLQSDEIKEFIRTKYDGAVVPFE